MCRRLGTALQDRGVADGDWAPLDVLAPETGANKVMARRLWMRTKSVDLGGELTDRPLPNYCLFAVPRPTKMPTPMSPALLRATALTDPWVIFVTGIGDDAVYLTGKDHLFMAYQLEPRELEPVKSVAR